MWPHRPSLLVPVLLAVHPRPMPKQTTPASNALRSSTPRHTCRSLCLTPKLLFRSCAACDDQHIPYRTAAFPSASIFLHPHGPEWRDAMSVSQPRPIAREHHTVYQIIPQSTLHKGGPKHNAFSSASILYSDKGLCVSNLGMVSRCRSVTVDGLSSDSWTAFCFVEIFSWRLCFGGVTVFLWRDGLGFGVSFACTVFDCFPTFPLLFCVRRLQMGQMDRNALPAFSWAAHPTPLRLLPRRRMGRRKRLRNLPANDASRCSLSRYDENAHNVF